MSRARRSTCTARILAGSLLNAAQEADDQVVADLIRLGMWTGARIEELCSLKVADVRTRKPRYLLNKYGDRSNAIGKRFGRLRVKLAVAKPSLRLTERHKFHSSRHKVVTGLLSADVPYPIIAVIVGPETDHNCNDQY